MVSLKNKFLFFSKLYSESGFWHFSIFFRFIQKSYSKLPLSTHWKSFSALWLFMNHQMTHWLSKRTFSKSLRFQHNFTGVSGIKRKWIDGRTLRDDHRRITGRLSKRELKRGDSIFSSWTRLLITQNKSSFLK